MTREMVEDDSIHNRDMIMGIGQYSVYLCIHSAKYI